MKYTQNESPVKIKVYREERVILTQETNEGSYFNIETGGIY
jgi:hypothetical protein